MYGAPPSSSYAAPPSTSRFNSAPSPSSSHPHHHEEPVEKHIAKQALAAGDSVAAMNAYMKLAAKRDKPEEEEPDRSQPLLNDTVFERRKVVAVYKDDGSRGHHMQDFIPPEELAKFMSKCGDEAAALAAKSMQERHALKDDNIGHQLLQKMGWREGQGIGVTQKGITAPLAASGVKQDNLGLGAAPVHEVSQEDDAFEQYRKRMMLGYKHRPNPLGNPRKPYY
jgi:splicing factor 4